jgi:hypothetical protein
MERNLSGALRAPGACGASLSGTCIRASVSDPHATVSSCSLHITRVTIDLPVRPTVTRVSTSSCFCAQSPALGAVQGHGPPDLNFEGAAPPAGSEQMRMDGSSLSRTAADSHASAENGGSGAGGAGAAGGRVVSGAAAFGAAAVQRPKLKFSRSTRRPSRRA